MAEMMLRRTRAAQVVPVFEEFARCFPNATTLVAAAPDEVRRVLKPLGLNWRIAQFQDLASQLIARHGGRVPQRREELLLLTGVSSYVADAVLVFAFNQARPIVDVTIARVIARLCGLREHAEARRNPEVLELAGRLLDRRNPRDYSFALLDLAGTVCTARNPLHETCPVANLCEKYFARTQGTYDGTKDTN